MIRLNGIESSLLFRDEWYVFKSRQRKINHFHNKIFLWQTSWPLFPKKIWNERIESFRQDFRLGLCDIVPRYELLNNLARGSICCMNDPEVLSSYKWSWPPKVHCSVVVNLDTKSRYRDALPIFGQKCNLSSLLARLEQNFVAFFR